MCFIIWVLLIILCKIDFFLQIGVHFRGHKSKLKLKISSNGFLVWIPYHLYEWKNEIKFHDCHGFKWQNINIYPILSVFFYSLTLFLAHWIVITHLHSHIWETFKVWFFEMFGGSFSSSIIFDFPHFQKWDKSCFYKGYHPCNILGELRACRPNHHI
jgi:hypothetical protein